MKKIIAAFDGLKYSEATKSYAVYLAKQTNTHLVGVFMDDPIYTSYKIYQLIVKEAASEDEVRKYQARDQDTRAAAEKKFETACQDSGVEYSIHHDRDVAI